MADRFSFLDRQRSALSDAEKELLTKEVLQSGDNPAFLLVNPDPSIEVLSQFLAGRKAEADRLVDGVGWLKFSSAVFLDTDITAGTSIVKRMREFVPTAEWIVADADLPTCWEPVLELFEFIVRQRFREPRIVVVAEALDARSGDEWMRRLFRLRRCVDLTGDGIEAHTETARRGPAAHPKAVRGRSATLARLDLSGWEPSGREIRRRGAELERRVRYLGGGPWHPAPPEDERKRAAALRGTERAVAHIVRDLTRGRHEPAPLVWLRNSLQSAGLGFLGRGAPKSFALIDWSSLDRAEALLARRVERTTPDPFVSLADLAAVVSASIFYDRIAVFDGRGLGGRARRALGIGDALVALDISGGPMRLLLEDHYLDTLRQFGRYDGQAGREPSWFIHLRENWKALLPHVEFPPHAASALEDALGYNASPDRQSWVDVLFHSSDDAGWRTNPGSVGQRNIKARFGAARDATWTLSPYNAALTILDNDVRAMLYALLAETLSRALLDHGGRVHYVGGCLRSPLLLARARYSEERLSAEQSIEDWLRSVWSERYRKEAVPVRIPFWLGAAIALCKNDRSAFPDVLAELRHRAAALRRRRAALEEAVRYGRRRDLQPLLDAVRGDLNSLTVGVESLVSGGAAVVEAVVRTQAPDVPDGLVEPARELAKKMGGSPWLRRLALRLFSPSTSIIYEMSAKDAEFSRPMQAAVDLFDIPPSDAREPLQFLRRLGRLTWVC